MPNEGEQTIPVVARHGEFGWAKTFMKNQLAAVSIPLSSVGEYCDAGCEVTFRNKGGVIKNLFTGAETPFERVHGVYCMDYWVPPPELVHNSGFTRQG